MSGGSKSSGNQVTRMEPPSFLVPYLKDAASAATELYGQGVPVYEGPRYTPQTELEQAGQQAALGQVGNLQEMAGASRQALMSALQGPEQILTDPNMQAAITGAVAPIQEQLMEKALPGISKGAVAAGQFGGSQQQALEGQAIREATRAQGDVASQMLMDAYQKQIGRQVGMAQLSNQILQQQMLPADIMQQVGGQQRAEGELARSTQEQIWREQAGAEEANLARYIQMLTGVAAPSGGTQTTTGGPGGPSTAARVAGSGLTGLGTYGALMMNPATAPFAMGGGLLAGALGLL